MLLRSGFFIDWKINPSLMLDVYWIACGQPGPILVFDHNPMERDHCCVGLLALCMKIKKNNNIRRFNNDKMQTPLSKIVLPMMTKTEEQRKI